MKLDEIKHLLQEKGWHSTDIENRLAHFGKEIISVRQDLILPEPENFPPIVQAIYSSLFTDKPVQYDRKQLLALVFVRQDLKVLKKMRELLQLTLTTIFKQLSTENLSHEFLIGHILSYMPFFAVENGEIFEIPIRYCGKWQLIPYRAQKITLTPFMLGSSISALALEAEDAPPLLLYKGTSYPTDEGFALSVLTDINPGSSSGAYAFCLGKKAIENWLKGKKARVFGLSLGGILALRTVAEFPTHIDTVYAFNPPTLMPNQLKTWQSYCQKNTITPNVHVIYHENDVVPQFGLKWGKHWKIYRVYLEEKKFFIQAHYKCFVSREKNLVLLVDAEKDEKKWSRFFLTLGQFILSFLLFPIAVIIYSYINACRLFKLLFFKQS